jgi:hypothetical protein
MSGSSPRPLASAPAVLEALQTTRVSAIGLFGKLGLDLPRQRLDELHPVVGDQEGGLHVQAVIQRKRRGVKRSISSRMGFRGGEETAFDRVAETRIVVETSGDRQPLLNGMMPIKIE